ncbi:MAG: hypothetical protein GF346_08690, partial [Candidatus Eisenbacteria bacterium]|nr:hypothetical protein [Candidatus Latescibacterota bacterium]MBD3302512.1 hypothetical protein [Candidatus Eisenbacteria bacterium]
MRRVAEAVSAIAALLVLAGGCGERSEIPEGASLRAELEADSAGLGDPVRLKMEAVLPEGFVPAFPGDADSIGAWAVLEAGLPREEGSGEWRRWVRETRITGLSLGWIGPESLRVVAAGAGGDTIRLAAAAPSLHVGGEIPQDAPPDPESARDIRDVVRTGPIVWPYWVAGAILLLVGFVWLIRFLRARRREEPAPAARPEPPIDPEREFEEAIRRLLAARHLEEGRVREYYYGISEAVRRYLGRVHGMPLRESSSGEVMRRLGPRIPEETDRDALVAWLREGDLVKYARLDRLQEEARAYLERSRNLARRLRPAP